MKEKYIAEIEHHIPFLNITGKTHKEISEQLYWIVDVSKQMVDKREHQASVDRRLDQARRNANV